MSAFNQAAVFLSLSTVSTGGKAVGIESVFSGCNSSSSLSWLRYHCMMSSKSPLYALARFSFLRFFTPILRFSDLGLTFLNTAAIARLIGKMIRLLITPMYTSLAETLMGPKLIVAVGSAS